MKFQKKYNKEYTENTQNITQKLNSDSHMKFLKGCQGVISAQN